MFFNGAVAKEKMSDDFQDFLLHIFQFFLENFYLKGYKICKLPVNMKPETLYAANKHVVYRVIPVISDQGGASDPWTLSKRFFSLVHLKKKYKIM